MHVRIGALRIMLGEFVGHWLAVFVNTGCEIDHVIVRPNAVSPSLEEIPLLPGCNLYDLTALRILAVLGLEGFLIPNPTRKNALQLLPSANQLSMAFAHWIRTWRRSFW